MTRQQFTMTEEQHDMMLSKLLPVMLIGGVDTRDITQLGANQKWKLLGKELGFVWDTAQPVSGKGTEVFTAEVIDE